MSILSINRSETEIVREGLDRLNTNVGISAGNATGSARNVLEITARGQSNLWDTMNNLLQQGYLSTAYGGALDKIGEGLQEPRNNARRAMDLSTSNLYFYLDKTFASNVSDLLLRYFTRNDLDTLESQGLIDSADNPGQINIPSSIFILSQDETISYTTVREITLSNTQDTDYTPLIANGYGPGFNVGPNILNKHNLVVFYPALAKIAAAIKVTNRFAIRNGDSTESDENYRFRLANKVTSAVAGNESAIRKAVLSVPGVVDMSLVPRTFGNGTLSIFPKTEDPIVSDGIIHAVRESVNAVKSVGTIIYVEVPEYLAVSFKIELRFAPGAQKSQIFGEARLAVMDYINNLSEGGEIIINEVIQRVMGVSDLILDMNVTTFGFGSYDRTTGIVTGYTPLRLMNQTADYNQRWFTNSSLCNLCGAGSN